MLFKEKFLGKNISRRRILSHRNKQNDKGQTIPMFSVINKNKENIHFGWVFSVTGTSPSIKNIQQLLYRNSRPYITGGNKEKLFGLILPFKISELMPAVPVGTACNGC